MLGKAKNLSCAGVAQLVEQLTCNQPVGGSTPLASSKIHCSISDEQKNKNRRGSRVAKGIRL